MRHIPMIQTLANQIDELLEIEGLEDRGADRVGGDLVDAALAGGGKDDDVRPFHRDGADALDELVAVQARHHQIEEHEIDGAVRLELVEADRAILGELNREVQPPEDSLQQYPDRKVIIDDQNPLSRTIEFRNWHSLSFTSSEMYAGLKCNVT